MGMDYVSGFLSQDVLMFLPRVIVAALILVIATVVSGAISKAINSGARAMNLRSANMLGSIAKYAVWVFAFIIALGQLGIAPAYMQIMFAGIIGMIAIAGAIAFGLGGKDAAGRFIDRLGQSMSHHE
jgi:small-conductance mechanosensitive channel